MARKLDSILEALRQISQEKLTRILDKIPGRKDLMIDQKILKPLDRIMKPSVLRLASTYVNKYYTSD